MAAPKSLQIRASSSTSKQLLKQISEHEARLKASQNQDFNPIADLLEPLANYVDAARRDNRSSNPEVIHALIYALHQIFSSLIRQGRIHGSPPENQLGAVKVVKDWLRDRYHEYIQSLISLLRLETEEGMHLELDSLTILMNLVRSESDVIRSLKSPEGDGSLATTSERVKYPAGGFSSPTFLKIVKALLQPTGDEGRTQVVSTVRAEFILRYLNFCDDIRYRFLRDAALMCQSYHPATVGQKSGKRPSETDQSHLTKNLLNYLESITTMPTETNELNQFWTGKPNDVKPSKKRKRRSSGSKMFKKNKVEDDGSTGIFDDPISASEDDESNDASTNSQAIKHDKTHPLLCLKAHQKTFSECWISLLSLPLPELEIKRVLKILHDQVIPHLIDPKVLMDFLVDCIDYGGTISILSLNALFTLMTKHNLDYPDFYTRLYSILDSTSLHTRYRPRLFRMLELFLSSTHLPVNILASFIKKMARLSLFAPPGAIITIVPFCYNLIKRHPSSMSMLHRTAPTKTSLKALELADPFSMEEPDPCKTNAIFSSLWEFSGMKSHYLASVSTLFKVFQESFDKPKYDLEDFLDHTYSSLIETEFNRPIRKPPALSTFAHSFTDDTKPHKTEPKQPPSAAIPDDILHQIWNI